MISWLLRTLVFGMVAVILRRVSADIMLAETQPLLHSVVSLDFNLMTLGLQRTAYQETSGFRGCHQCFVAGRA